MMTLSNIYSYPLKSGKAIASDSADVVSTGLLGDRTFVVIDESDNVVTGREFPALTSIVANLVENRLKLTKDGLEGITIALPNSPLNKVNFKLFRNRVEGLRCDSVASDWLSDILGTNCRLVFIKNNFRPIDPKRGGKKGDLVGYADASPFHLISEASVETLNSLLDKRVSALHFRPNLVIKGGDAFDEDLWKTVVINDCEFEVHHVCKRCIFSTVDPVTATKDEHIEPLTTLAKFRSERNEPLSFGIYLIPRKTGSVQFGNDVYIRK